MTTLTQAMTDSLFAGYLTEKSTVPDEKALKAMAASTGTSVEAVKDAFAEKWRAAGNLDDPFGRNPEDEDADD